MRKTLAVALVATMTVSLTACRRSAAKDTAAMTAKASAAENTTKKIGEGVGADETEKAAGTEKEKQYKFGFTEVSTGSFFNACYSDAEEVVKANGDEIVHVKGKADSVYQLGVVEGFISQRRDPVFHSPSDAAALAVVIKVPNDVSVPIVNFNSAVNDLSRMNYFVVSDSYPCGQIADEESAKSHPEGEKVAVLDFPASAAAADRAEGPMDIVMADGLLEVVAQMDAGAKPEKELTVMQDLLQVHSNLIIVLCISDEYAQGTYSAITTAGDKTKIYSVNAGPEAKVAVTKDGVDGI